MRNKDKMAKEDEIKKELAKLKKIFSHIPESKMALVEKLIQNAAYMSITLDELQATVNKEGATLTSKNGNGFDIIQEHPANKAYTALIAKYSSVISQLQSLLPDSKQDSVNKAGEALAEFIAKGK